MKRKMTKKLTQKTGGYEEYEKPQLLKYKRIKRLYGAISAGDI